MAASHQTKIEEYKAKIEAKNAEIEALETLQDEISSADKIAETRLSKLFHEARTTKKGHWKSVTAFCDIEDGEIVVKSLDKISDGRWSPETRQRYDVLISVGVRPFMEARNFKRTVQDDITQAIQGRQNTIGNLDSMIHQIEIMEER